MLQLKSIIFYDSFSELMRNLFSYFQIHVSGSFLTTLQEFAGIRKCGFQIDFYAILKHLTYFCCSCYFSEFLVIAVKYLMAVFLLCIVFRWNY